MAMAVFAAASGTIYYTFGVFLGPMAEEMGWSRGVTSVAFSLFTMINGVAGPPTALVIERLGPRTTMLLAQLLMAAGLLLVSRVTEVWHLFLVYGVLLALALNGTTYLCITTLLTNWFTRRRSLAIGAAMAGSGLGTAVLAPVGRYLIELLGWREAWMVMAGVVLVSAFIPTFLLARNHPEELGQQPDGGPPRRKPSQAAPPATVQPEWPVRSAFRSPALWIITFMAFANGFALSMVTTHQVVHLEDMGIAPVAAASALGVMVFISSAGRLAGGAVGQWIQLRYVASAACALEAMGLVVLLMARSLPMVYGYVLVFGLGYGAVVILFPSMVGNYFGRRSYTRLFSVVFALVSLLGAAAPALAGFVFDATESYVVPFSVAAGFCAIAAVASLVNRVPVPMESGQLQRLEGVQKI